MSKPRLDRNAAGVGAPAKVRMVHCGPGAFFRAHQAWYTDRAGDGWGIAAVTQRSDDMVGRLGDQDGLYTLLTRGPDGDDTRVTSSISEVVGHADPRGVELFADPDVTVATLTVTEAGYRPGAPALDRLVAGLGARRRADAGPISLVSCDNLSANGAVLRARLLETAEAADPTLATWIETTCAFPSTVVDRITPASRPADLEAVAELTGFDDRAAIVTEPWSEWIIEDAFAAARPAWERAGAGFVADVAPFEQRKLRLLNAGHCLLAYVGGQRGHTLVNEAMEDPTVHEALVALWAEARDGLDPAARETFESYCAGVEHRWTNRRLPHMLVQIGTDGSLKLRERIVPIIVGVRDAGGEATTAALVLGAWVAYLRGHGAIEVRDARADQLRDAAAGSVASAVAAVLRVLDERIADDAWVLAAVTEAAERFDNPVSRKDAP